ncbi:hypothetical protein B0S90_0685 [Caldicellulosiruptor bescii]|uniref:Uncharacterized protein n=1 Tax=Caldicellulosiruptor bescii TaxID=31899 RepID=A0ABY1SBE4_CALBS|nr:hypothetical protein [Caldicellulosiruptor bescii]PBC89572.1 hypothetical protein B0S87_2687 [Caldicellulosiruptor bescii]PBC89895.1 hypothetical protein B0S89_0189 [Caldicellulosiruptor bescii]PBD04679.1 hypothetical protein B0S85_2360 [Caldicellulosiruptor bescii]PBD05691.1 hypothetical protein B0S90_0685 [Caldicellulosiruptor bescii]PBD09306.1 hypothetical protein B0S84_1714 [Caldicellulosiruptor bescii]
MWYIIMILEKVKFLKARKRIIVLLSIMILILKSTFVLSNDKDEKDYYDYTGKKGKKNIVMSIYINNSKVTGLYAYKGVRKYIKVEGIIKGGKIKLNELDSKGKVVGTFNGIIKDKVIKKSDGRLIRPVDIIEGTWSDGKIKMPFKLINEHEIYMPYGEKFSFVGFPDDEVLKFATNIQEYLIKNDKKALGKLIAYPIKVKIDGKKKTIRNEKEFINNFDKIFDANLKKAIINAEPLIMPANQYEAMLGEGGYNV